jgi:hypothetical protein
MSFPTGWPPRPASNTRSIRVYIAGTATANFSDSAYLFSQVTGANTIVPTPYVPPGSTAPVAFGTQLVSGSPQGGGTDPRDASVVMPSGLQTDPVPMIWARGMRICNDGAGVLQISFDGTNVHGSLHAGEQAHYLDRFEAGICLRGAGLAFRVEAW